MATPPSGPAMNTVAPAMMRAAPAPAPVAAGVTVSDVDIRARFAQLVKQKELNPVVADKLFNIFSKTDVALVIDDSDSMAQAIAEEGTDRMQSRVRMLLLRLRLTSCYLRAFCCWLADAVFSVAQRSRPNVLRGGWN
jgi:hypothetical protein